MWSLLVTCIHSRG